MKCSESSRIQCYELSTFQIAKALEEQSLRTSADDLGGAVDSLVSPKDGVWVECSSCLCEGDSVLNQIRQSQLLTLLELCACVYRLVLRSLQVELLPDYSSSC